MRTTERPTGGLTVSPYSSMVYISIWRDIAMGSDAISWSRPIAISLFSITSFLSSSFSWTKHFYGKRVSLERQIASGRDLSIPSYCHIATERDMNHERYRSDCKRVKWLNLLYQEFTLNNYNNFSIKNWLKRIHLVFFITYQIS